MANEYVHGVSDVEGTVECSEMRAIARKNSAALEELERRSPMSNNGTHPCVREEIERSRE